ncbi:hypothetical protein MSG28_002982 [Choristoneura fumiferana]|nr:hypothetical protein MSG28_002982 [Choristoneura fumiferana]
MCQVNTEPMMIPPDIDDEASSGEVLMKEGEDASLRCVASGTPPPTIVWRREDSRHFRINNQTLVSKWNGEWLNLTSAERAASGAYLCIASNGVPPSVSKRIIINMMFAPSIWAGRVAIRAPSGSAVTLQCTAEAYPPPQVFWTLNSEQKIANTTTVKDLVETNVHGDDDVTRRRRSRPLPVERGLAATAGRRDPPDPRLGPLCPRPPRRVTSRPNEKTLNQTLTSLQIVSGFKSFSKPIPFVNFYEIYF